MNRHQERIAKKERFESTRIRSHFLVTLRHVLGTLGPSDGQALPRPPKSEKNKETTVSSDVLARVVKHVAARHSFRGIAG